MAKVSTSRGVMMNIGVSVVFFESIINEQQLKCRIFCVQYTKFDMIQSFKECIAANVMSNLVNE